MTAAPDGWTSYSDTDAFEDRNAKILSAKNIDKVKQLCKYEGFGGFIVWKGSALCRRMQPKTLFEERIPMPGATLYIAPEPDCSGHSFGQYSERMTLDSSGEDIFYKTYAEAFTDQLTGKTEAGYAEMNKLQMNFPAENLRIETNGFRLVRSLSRNALVNSSSIAFNNQIALTLSPDSVWLQIVIGLSHHIHQSCEFVREDFIVNDGLPVLNVCKEEFVRDQWNPWGELFSCWSLATRKHIGKKTHSKIVPYFVTSTDTSRIASEMMLLNINETYFPSVSVAEEGGGGIPSFKIKGSPHDWRDIQRRIKLFVDIDSSLSWWTDSLLPLIAEIEKSCAGSPTTEFWKKWFTKSKSKGVEGYLLFLFPYMNMEGKFERNVALLEKNSKIKYSEQDFPSSVSIADFSWGEDEYKFTSGLFGTVYTDEETVEPVVGWAVSKSLH